MPPSRARELMQAHVRTIMNARLITAAPEDSLADAARKIAAHAIGAVPVMAQDGKLAGVLATTDLVYLLQDGSRLDAKLVRDAMTAPAISIDEFATVDEAIGLMRNAMIHHLPVVREGKLVGLVTASDLIRHLLQNYPSPDVA